MQNLIPLKLSKLVLYKEVNNQKQIFGNVNVIALHQAKRCYAIMHVLHENNQRCSIKSIQFTNFKIIRKIENLTKWSKYMTNIVLFCFKHFKKHILPF